MDDFGRDSVALHVEARGKLSIGVAEVCLEIARTPSRVFDLTLKHNTVAVVSDGSAILGLGNLGPEAAIPVMEGKAILFKEFAGVDAFPICLATQDTNEIIRTVRAIAPVFGGINLEDISAPRCFEVEAGLQDLGIPVFHDDQHGTAIVVVAALLNALRVTKKDLAHCKVVFNGSGASALACARLLLTSGERGLLPKLGDLILCDSKGIVHTGRTDLNAHKRELAEKGNRENKTGTLADAIKGADVFIGLSSGNLVTQDMIRSMNKDPIVFPMANPTPEIMPDLAIEAGAAIVGTGRSDFANQINNVLAFPGVFRGAFDAGATRIHDDMKLEAARALAMYVTEPNALHILPDPLDRAVAPMVAKAVAEAARKAGVCR
jgi:malate dehydrogenase (oxaloacetate-decarboxylating)